MYERFSRKDIIVSGCIMLFTVVMVCVIGVTVSLKAEADKKAKLLLPITIMDIGTPTPFMSEDISEEDYNAFVSASAGSVFDTYSDFKTTASCNTSTTADNTISA